MMRPQAEEVDEEARPVGRRRWRALLGTALVACGWIGCGVERLPERSEGSALWVTGASLPLSNDDYAQLGGVGIGELFVASGELSWSGETPILTPASEDFAPPRQMTATLAVGGTWSAADFDPQVAARQLALTLERWRLAAEDRRLLTVGVHFDLDLPNDRDVLQSFAECLTAVREQLNHPLALSVRVPSSSLADSAWRSIAEAADFLVVSIYGQRPGEEDDPADWDLTAVAERLDAMDVLGRPYLTEIVTLGAATLLSSQGVPGDTVTVGDVQGLAWNQDLEIRHGMTLDRGARQVYGFVAKARTSAALRVLEGGERLRVVATSTPIVAELLEELREEARPLHRGSLFYRLPAGGEEFGLSLSQILNAHHGGASILPDLDLDVDVVSRGGGRWALTLTLRNRNEEPTELSVLDANWVQVQLQGAFVNWVRPGHFPRYQTFKTGSDGKLYVTLRHADTFRLYVPMVKGADELVAGPVEIRGWSDGKPALLVGGAFITPYGGSLELPPKSWPPVVEDAGEDAAKAVDAP
ncbi:MAG: hypothetical protein K8J08_01435 [Thermoanaerobaculia bacterium]|nr:hypothetical protein [Thermoanaerobaculia bacterium]